MKCVENAPDGSIEKVYLVSPAHSNSSPVEAWISTVRAGRQDLAVNYATCVGGKEMVKSDTALKKNPMRSLLMLAISRKGIISGH